MAIAVWPAGLDHRPQRAGYKWKPHDTQLRTEMEQGPARKRRLWSDSPAYVSASWTFDIETFELFRAWHHAVLEDGALWCRMPIYTGAAFATLPCRFNGPYQAALHGLEWTVTADVEVRQVPYLTADDDEAIEARAFPEALDPLPIREGYMLTPHRAVGRGDLAGPAQTRRWFEDGPVSPTVQWAFTGAQFELFRAWYHTALRDGVTWFSAAVWVGGQYGTRQCRFVDAFEAELQLDYRWLVTAPLEIRDAPFADIDEQFLLLMLGEPAFLRLTGGIHHFVHETYPEASR